MVLIRGITLNLHPEGEALSDHIRTENDFFEANILDFIRDNFPVQGTIVDIGANIGNHSAYFANYLQYRQILAFEPVPDNYVLLAMNCAHYKGYYPFKLAVSNQVNLVHVSPNHENMGASKVTEDGEIEVMAIPLDMLALYDCTLIKIDVEYHEREVLLGAYATIQKNKPLILIEDSTNEYGQFLPDYECIQAWPGEKTYLYKWKRND